MQNEGIKKLYYSIGEVSEQTGLEPYVLRYWETEFSALQPRKNRAGRRIYTDDDIATVQRIQHLLKEEKFTIEGARQVLARGDEHDESSFRQELKILRGFLANLLESL